MQESYNDFQKYMAYLGYIRLETTEPRYLQLRKRGYTFSDIVSIESDLQAGFSLDEAIQAIH